MKNKNSIIFINTIKQYQILYGVLINIPIIIIIKTIFFLTVLYLFSTICKIYFLKF